MPPSTNARNVWPLSSDILFTPLFVPFQKPFKTEPESQDEAQNCNERALYVINHKLREVRRLEADLLDLLYDLPYVACLVPGPLKQRIERLYGLSALGG